MNDLHPHLFDLDEPAPQRPLWDRPRWDKVPCHICGDPLTRWVRLNSGLERTHTKRIHRMSPVKHKR